MELVDFLRARLDEDAAAAKCVESRWRQIGETGVIVASDGSRAEECANGNWAGIAEHIVRHDPDRVLRRVEADRRLLDVHAKQERDDGCVVCDAGNESCGCMGGNHWSYPCDTVKLLALPFADHPDYQQEWKP